MRCNDSASDGLLRRKQQTASEANGAYAARGKGVEVLRWGLQRDVAEEHGEVQRRVAARVEARYLRGVCRVCISLLFATQRRRGAWQDAASCSGTRWFANCCMDAERN